jgi:hypothetical protein
MPEKQYKVGTFDKYTGLHSFVEKLLSVSALTYAATATASALREAGGIFFRRL